jgi:transcriptional regulator with XRE-family HTH domain
VVARSLTEAFGLVVRDARLKADLSQEALAEMAGLHRTYVSDLERGRTSISIRKLEGLAGALGTKPHLLVKAAERRLLPR